MSGVTHAHEARADGRRACACAVRLPVCPATLRSTGRPSGALNTSVNPDLANKTPLQVLDRIVAEFATRGFYVLLDHHGPDRNAISTTPQIPGCSMDQRVADPQFVADRYRNVPNVFAIDLKNEPHSTGGSGAFWGTGDINNDWKLAAERAGSAVLSSNSKLGRLGGGRQRVQVGG